MLEKPLEYWLAHKEVDFHYHFCWANENWSKLWDGGNQEIILKQELKEVDAESFFNDMLPYFQDSRYEKIDNRPILMIYKPSLFPKEDFMRFIGVLQQLAKQNGFDGLYITFSPAGVAKGSLDPVSWGGDALTEFPPHGVWEHCREIRNVNRLISSADFVVRDMREFIEKKYISFKRIILYISVASHHGIIHLERHGRKDGALIYLMTVLPHG